MDSFQSWNLSFTIRSLYFSLSVCGGDITGSNHGNINSPGYPGNYPVNRDCVWTVTVDAGMYITFAFGTLELEDHSTCDYDYLEVCLSECALRLWTRAMCFLEGIMMAEIHQAKASHFKNAHTLFNLKWGALVLLYPHFPQCSNSGPLQAQALPGLISFSKFLGLSE